MKRSLDIDRPVLWALLAVPGVWIQYRYLTDAMSYGQVVHSTGEWAVWLLIATLAVTPLRLTFPRAFPIAWLMRRRRELGVATFGYALFHTLVYAVRKAELATIIKEGNGPELLTGWITLLIFAALAITSNDVSVRAMGRAWKRLHLAVYLGTALTFAHWLLVAFDPKEGAIYLAVVVLMELWRLIRLRRTSSAPRSS